MMGVKMAKRKIGFELVRYICMYMYVHNEIAIETTMYIYIFLVENKYVLKWV